MKIFLNGEESEVENGVSLSRLLELLSLPEQRIAIELNKTVVRKRDWVVTEVREGDKVEIVHFVGGG